MASRRPAWAPGLGTRRRPRQDWRVRLVLSASGSPPGSSTRAATPSSSGGSQEFPSNVKAIREAPAFAMRQ
jgi:hypothetical protein